MAGNRSGGLQAAATKKATDPDFYHRIGADGGRASNTGGFFGRPDLAREAGRRGGKIGKRGKIQRSTYYQDLAQTLTDPTEIINNWLRYDSHIG